MCPLTGDSHGVSGMIGAAAVSDAFATEKPPRPRGRRVLASAPYTEVAGEGHMARAAVLPGAAAAPAGRGEVGEQRITLQCCLATRSPVPGRTATV